MALEDKLKFREALLEHRTLDEWKDHRLDHLTFYREKAHFEDKDISYGDLIKTYAARFPADRDYSTRAHLNRVLADCEIPQFSFTRPDVLRGFLSSCKSPAEWKKYQPSFHTFNTLPFQYHGIKILGQMFLYHVFAGLENQRNGTYYAVLDYQENKELGLFESRSQKFITRLFDIADIEVKGKYISDVDLTPEKLHEILLNKYSAEEWTRLTSVDFYTMWFDIPRYRNFTGVALLKRYRELRGGNQTAKALFSEARIEIGSSPALLRRRLEDRFERFYSMLDDPLEMRRLFLQLQTEEEWAKPRQYAPLRKQRVQVNGDRNITLHTLCHLYSIYRYNSAQESIDSYIGFDEAQKNYPGVLQSNKKVLGEMLDFAGINYIFVPDVGEVDLHDPMMLRRMLFHGKLEGRDLPPSEIRDFGIQEFRKIRFRDPITGLELAGQSLLIYYSALHYVKEHPEVGLDKAATTLRKGQSNSAVMSEILERSGLASKRKNSR